MRVGNFQIDVLSDGQFWLDGGAMFGVIPRALWGKVTTPDKDNRIALGLNCLLVQTEKQKILVDTGCGRKYTEKQIQIYGIEGTTSLAEQLNEKCISPSEIDLVINTHLHFDHCGGNTHVEDGQPVPSFPNATYLVNAEEFKDANNPNERTRASYFRDNWIPLKRSGQLQLVTGEFEAATGVTIVHTPGHTAGHQSLKIQAEGQTLFFFGDLCPTSVHVPLPWIMSYDLFPLTTLETRKRIYRQAVEEEWLVVFEHDPRHPSGYLREEEGKYRAEPVSWDAQRIG